MPAYLQLAGIPGEATDQNHLNWIHVENMTLGTTRSIQQGAKDQLRARGETTLADIIVDRHLDKSSTKLAEACAAGKYFTSAKIELCTTVLGRQQTFLSITLKNVIVSSYSFHGKADGNPPPSERITLSYTDIDKVYTVVDPKTGATQGQVPVSYNPASGVGTM